MLDKSQIPQFIQRDNLYDELPCGFITFDPDGHILAANKTIANWTGQSTDELLSQTFKSLLTKASLLYYNLFLDPILRIKGFVEEINLQLVGKNGNFDILFNGKSYKDKDEKLVLINATVLRIGDRKKYEAQLLSEKRHAEQEKSKLQFLINLVPIQIWTADPKGKMLSMNLQMQEYFGAFTLDDGSEFLGVSELDRKAAYNDWQDTVKKGIRYEREARFVGISGKPEWFFITAEPYYNSDDQIEMWFCCSININKKKLLQIANQMEMKSNLSSAYKTLDHHEARFSTIALNQSHMVRKPLANILGLIEIISDKQEPEDLSIVLNMLYESVKELDSMIKLVSKDIL
jgi:PAS domain-containing protein